MTVRASVLIPTYDHATTLPLTVASVLRQSVADLEVLVIGDGVTDDNREAILALTASDERVRFLDFAKGPHHGESYRHEAILEARSDRIFYLCDDDLLLPDHVADLIGLLEHANFVQSRNGFIRPDGSFGLHPADLSDPRCLAWHLQPEPRRNATSLTGTAHSRAFYLEVGDAWETTPAGEWPDHYQWKKLMRHAAFRGATSERMTALQLPTSEDGRDTWTPQERYDELARWAEVVAAPDAQARIDLEVERAARHWLARGVLDAEDLRHELAEARSLITERDTYVHELHLRLTAAAEAQAAQGERIVRLRASLDRRGRKLASARAERDAARAELAAVRRSRSWRLTAPLRALRAGRRGQ